MFELAAGKAQYLSDFRKVLLSVKIKRKSNVYKKKNGIEAVYWELDEKLSSNSWKIPIKTQFTGQGIKILPPEQIV